MDISVVGAGYVGLIQAAGLAKLGNKVLCIDIDKEKVAKINNKQPPIYEKGLKELLGRIVPKNLTATTSLREAVLSTQVTFICVGTPSKKIGEILLHQLEGVCREIGLILKNKDKHLIVIKSTI